MKAMEHIAIDRGLVLRPSDSPALPYVYVASSWRNPWYPAVIDSLILGGIPHYDFRNPEPTEPGSGFAWADADPSWANGGPVRPFEYLGGVEAPAAIAGYERDYRAMQDANTFILILPCGRSAHLELGWAVGQGKRTAILLDDPCTPELMYRMVDYIAPDLDGLLNWISGS